MRILIDIDNTLCDNMGEWLAIYNEESRDSLVPEDIKTWDIESYLRPEYIEFFWEVAYPKSFINSTPFPYARLAIVNFLANGHEITYVTAGVCEAKMEWMFDMGFTEGKHWLAPKNIVIAYKKDLIVGDILIDDGVHNVEKRPSILFDQPWNRDTTLTIPRANSWIEVEEYINQMPKF